MGKLNSQHYKDNLAIAIPVTISQLGHIAVGFSDTIMAGRLINEDALAAAATAGVVFFPFLMLGIGMSYGSSPIIAKADGEKNHARIRELFKHNLVMHFSAAIILTLLVYLAATWMELFISSEKLLKEAVPFAKILAFSMAPLMIFQAYKQFAEGLSVTKQATVITITSNILNIVLAYVLIKGLWIFPAMGLVGIAWATFVARCFMALSMMIFVLSHRPFFQYTKRTSEVPFSRSTLSYMIQKSIPAGLQLCAETAAFAGAIIMVEKFGTVSVAAHQIALNMAAVTYMAATGIAAAASVRVGNELGRRDFPELRKAGLTNFTLVLIFMSFCSVIFIVFKDILPLVASDKAAIIDVTSSLLVIAAVFQIADGVQAVGVAALRGLGDVRMPTIIALISYWIIALPLAYLFGFTFKLGVEGVWYGLSIGLFVAAALLYARFRMLTNPKNTETEYRIQ